LSAPSALAPALRRLIAERQADRLPSVAAAVVRDGEEIWADAVGTADYDAGVAASPELQYRVGSITKTFTATAIMQLRDAGALDLDDRLDAHLDGVANGAPTIRRLLSHLSGIQREAGEMYVDGTAPTEAELLASMQDVEFVLPPAEAHHYSNLAFALLGSVVARKSGMPYAAYVDERILAPLGLGRTTWQPQPPFAQGYLVDEYARTVWKEEATDIGATLSAGQLWSTVGDLGRWATFLARGAEGVLDARTVRQMWFPQAMFDPDDWTLGFGLGLMLLSYEKRIYAGHGGAMAGFLAGVYVDRKSGVGAAAVTNSGTRGEMDLLAVRLAAKTLELWPDEIEPWHPEDDPPDDVRSLLGRWWSEGNEFLFWWENGELRARFAAAPPHREPTVFAREEGAWRAVAGRERGERLRVDGDRLIWAGYAFTRAQEPFTRPS